MTNMDTNQIIIYQGENGETRIEVKFTGDTVWLSQQQMAELYQTTRPNIVQHIRNIYEDGELEEKATCKNFLQVRQEGTRQVSREIPFYNLDMIISLGYRIRSVIATHFRRWATERLKEYIIKGFTMDDERLKGNGGGAYWRELLDRIRDIRSSEKVMYRQVLDLYATAVDYDPRSDISIEFFKIVQNKLHFAAHGHTAAEVIFNRANAESPLMGLTSFKGDHPTLRDSKIAKNYLSEEELKILNNLVSGYFDFAEIQAMRRRPMYMNDYVQQLDNILSSTGEALLKGAGSISHQQAMEKAEREYRLFQVRELSPVEKAYLETIKELNAKAKGKQGDKSV
ncbi:MULTISPECIES: virulence RhuM family protein [Bacteroidaceae]|uniref:virulence RhuM family protein n=1 Tax=Bacteroides acidifaciens TaxID=85831 RepID=UPI00255803AB|nr:MULTISPECIES: virulence RhuM family protein [Bacteroidaceae]